MPVQGDVQLKIGYWIVSHKDQLRKWWALLLLGFIAFSTFWAMFFLSWFYWQQPAADRLIRSAALGLNGWQAATTFAPSALTMSPVTVIRRDSQHADVVATITNPNRDWGAAQVRWHFQTGNSSLPAQTVFVNPTGTRPVLQLNLALPAEASSPTIMIDDVQWQRASEAALPVATFLVDQPELTRATVTRAGQTVTSYSVKAQVANRSVYNYYRVVVPVVLKSNGNIVAVDELTIERWPTLSSRLIHLTWPYAIPAADAVELFPQVSQFDRDNVYR